MVMYFSINRGCNRRCIFGSQANLTRWLRLIEHRELTASLQLLVLSVVIYLLTQYGFGTFCCIKSLPVMVGSDPDCRTLWQVILPCGSPVQKEDTLDRSIGWFGIFYSCNCRTGTLYTQHPVMVSAAISGTLAACGIMFFRMVVLIGVIEPALLSTFGAAMMIAGILLLGMALWRQRQITSAETTIEQ